MSDTDVFREVDEDYRRERMVVFWRRYGALVAALAVAVMIAAGALDYMNRRAQAEKALATAELNTLMAAAVPGNEAKAADALAAYAAQADKNHATLARITEAALRQRVGDLDGAARLYHQIADDSSVDSDLRDLAVVRLGYLAVDQAKPEPLIPRLGPIAGKDGPWRYSAKEAIALLTARAGQRESAASMLAALADDPNAPPDLAGRAHALAELYRGK
jgi:hypothetical protein